MFENMPDEVMLILLKLLPPKDQMSLQHVNMRFNRLVQDQSLDQTLTKYKVDNLEHHCKELEGTLNPTNGFEISFGGFATNLWVLLFAISLCAFINTYDSGYGSLPVACEVGLMLFSAKKARDSALKEHKELSVMKEKLSSIKK
jgi:hypothetical protein